MMMMMVIKGGLSSDQALSSDVAFPMLPVESNIAVHGNDVLTHSSVIVSSPVVKSHDAVLANEAVIAHDDSLPPPTVASSQVIHSDVAAPVLPVVPAEIDGVYSRDTCDVLSDHDIDDDLHAIPSDDDGGSTSEMSLDQGDRYWGDDQPSVNAATVAADDFNLSNALASAAVHPDAVPLSSGTDPPSNYNSFCHMVTKLLTLDVVGKNHDTNGIDGVDHGSVGFQDYSASSIQLLPGQKGFPKYQLDNLTPSDIEQISKYFTKSVGKEALGSTLVDVLPYFLHLDGQLKVVFDKTLVNTVVDMKSFVAIATKQHQLFHGNVQALAYIMFYVKKLWTPSGIVLLQVVVKNCPTCDIYMSFKTIPSSLGSFHFYPPFTTFSIDYIELPPSRMAYVQPITPSKPYKYVLQAVEMSTGLLFGVPAMSADSLTVFTLLYILKMLFPTAKVLTSDNGSHFRNGYVTEIAQKFGLQWTFGATYTPQNQGRIERCNQSLKRVLKTLVSDKEGFSDWINHYFQAVSIYNSTPNLCGYSPFYLSYGVPPSPGTEDKNPELQSIPRLIPQDRPHDNVLLFKLDSGLVLDAQSVLDHEMFYTAIRLAAINSDIQPSREKNFDSKYQARQMRRILAEPLGKKFTYSVGQWVYLRRFKPNHKLQPGYVGPFIVNKILGPTRYQLRYPDLASETYIPPNTIDGKVPVAPTSQISGSKVKLLPGVNDYNAKDLRPYYMAYGSPLLSVADLSQRFGAQERSTFKRLLDGYEHEVSVSANRLSATASLAFLEHVLDVYIESPPDF